MSQPNDPITMEGFLAWVDGLPGETLNKSEIRSKAEAVQPRAASSDVDRLRDIVSKALVQAQTAPNTDDALAYLGVAEHAERLLKERETDQLARLFARLMRDWMEQHRAPM